MLLKKLSIQLIIKQKMDSKSLTEAKLININDILCKFMDPIFCRNQGYRIQ